MSTMVLYDDDIAYTIDPIKMCRKSQKRINVQILALIMDPFPTEENETNINELYYRECCLEVRKNESFS